MPFWIWAVSFALAFLTFLIKWAENHLFRKTYQHIHRDNLTVANFNFRKKQLKDEKKKARARKKARVKMRKQRIKTKIEKLSQKMKNS
jgi:Ca2+-transporting ATPase